MDPVFEFVFLTTALFTILLLLRRVRQLERQRPAAAPPAPAPDAPAAPAAAVDVDTDTWAMLVTPLESVLGQCELARGQRRMDGRLEAIEKQALRMREILESVPSARQRIEDEIEEVDTGAFAQEAADAYSGLALDRDVGVHMMVEPTPAARVNARLLRRALRHLVRTGITSAPAGRGDVTVAVGLLPADGPPTHIGFAVADDGPGIETARLVRILDPSIEEGVAPSAEELAYSVVYALARAIGGQFVLDSAPGTGTRATIKVPLHAAALRELESAPAAEPEAASF